jgi:hypothetical protein
VERWSQLNEFWVIFCRALWYEVTTARTSFRTFYQSLSSAPFNDVSKTPAVAGKLFQFTKICRCPELTIAFSAPKSMYRFPRLFAHILNCYQWNQTLIHYSHPDLIRNIDISSAKYSIVPRRSYSRGKMRAERANPDTSALLGKFLLSCDGNQNDTSWELFATQCCLS